jgi:hypothetical protein
MENTFTTKVSLIILSHLEDMELEISTNPEMASKRMRLVRILISEYPDTNVRISDEKLDELWNGLSLGEF